MTPNHVKRKLAAGGKLVGIANELRFMTGAVKAARDAIQA